MVAHTQFASADSGTEFAREILAVRPALLRYAHGLTRDPTAAEDLVQDTFYRAWAARSRFEPGTNTRAWLFRIARNAFLSGLRRTRRQVAWDPDHHQLMLVQAPTQDGVLYARDIHAALNLLPASQRTALLLTTQDGLSTADAANELGIAQGTVKSRVSRARATILAYVEGDLRREHPHRAEHREVATRRVPGLDEQVGKDRFRQWKESGQTVIG